MKGKESVNGLDIACFSLYFIEDNIMTQIKIYMCTDKPLFLLHVFEQITVFCNL